MVNLGGPLVAVDRLDFLDPVRPERHRRVPPVPEQGGCPVRPLGALGHDPDAADPRDVPVTHQQERPRRGPRHRFRGRVDTPMTRGPVWVFFGLVLEGGMRFLIGLGLPRVGALSARGCVRVTARDNIGSGW
jgi:hypothetical protein